MPRVMTDTGADEACKPPRKPHPPKNSTTVLNIIHWWPCFTALLPNHFQTFRQQLKGCTAQAELQFGLYKMSSHPL